MAGVVIQKAVIEVEFDDLNKAQLALKKAGVEMVDFGKQADKAKGGTKGFGSSIGDLSEKLDKKLEQGLGRAFKATDRLASILGQAGTVAAVVGIAVSGLAAAYLALKDKTAAANVELAKATAGFLDQAAAASFAASVVDELANAHGRTIAQMKASALAKVVLEKATKAASIAIATEAKIRSDIESSKWGTAALIGLNLKLAKAKDASTLATQNLANATGDLNRKNKETFVDALPSFIQAGVISAKQAATDIGAAYDQVEADVTSSFEAWKNSANASQRDVAKTAKQAASETLDAWLMTFDAMRAAGGGLDAVLFGEAVERFDAGSASMLAMAEVTDELSDALDRLGAASAGMQTEMADSQGIVLDWGHAVDTVAVPAAVAITEGVTAAAFAAIAHGASFKDVLNDFLEAKSLEFTVSALGEVAKGIAASFLNPGLAGSHFAAAAAFGVAATAAGAGVALTGGFNGPTAASEGGGEREAFTGGADTGPDRSTAGGGVTETNINLNFAAGAGMSRIERAQTAQEVIGLMREAGASV